jgi:dihydrofolate reductase
MRKVRYSVAASLDSYVAGPGDEFDWIPMDPDIDFGALFEQFDTLLMGRRTYEITTKQGPGMMPGLRVYVASKTLKPEDHPAVTILGDDLEATVRRLREEKGKDIWLFGGGSLFNSLLNLGLVDTLEVAVVPVLLGGGLPLLPTPARRAKLRYTGQQLYPKTGIITLKYDVEHAPA